MAVIQELFEAIGKGKKNDVAAIVQENVDNGADVRSILNETMIPAMRSVGDKFSRGEAFVPEMLIAARAMQAGLDIIEPILAEGGHKPIAKVAI
jgi:5-methyltetrahydrofolate--homocysteine methyltransferase